MARMERGQPTDPAALIRPIESKPGADAVTDSTLVQAYQRLRGAVLLEPLFEEGLVAVIGLECEDFPPLLNERKQCMAMVGADIDHDRSLQCGVEQLGDAIGLVIVRPRSSAEGSDRPRFAHRHPDTVLDPIGK